MAKLMSMFSGKSARKQMMSAEMEAARKREELAGLDEEDDARKAIRKARGEAATRGGAASTRLSSDTILGGSAPLG